MIVIIAEEKGWERAITEGDDIILSHSGRTPWGERTDTEVLKCKIVKTMTIDYWCIFVFATDNGIVLGNNMGGFFGQSFDLPKEIQGAMYIDDLNKEQLRNLKDTCPLEVKQTHFV